MQTNYVNEESFKTYVDYLALKKHFSSDGYDYQRYQGKIKASFDSFQTKGDAFFFYKLSQKKERHEILVSNIVINPKIWIRELCEDEAYNVYLEWKKKMDGISYLMSTDMSNLKEDYSENFVIEKKGKYPYIVELLMNKKISLETFTILTNMANIFPYWEKENVDKIIFGDIIRKSKKYYPFLEINDKKIKSLIKSRFF